MKAALARRGAAGAVDELIARDAERRELLPRLEERRAEQNRVSEEIAETKRAGGNADQTIAAMRELAAEIKDLERNLAGIEEGIDALLPELPNLPEAEAPEGAADASAEPEADASGEPGTVEG